MEKNIVVMDHIYKVSTLEEIKRFLEHDQTNLIKGVSMYDCEDFAFRLKGQFAIQGWSGIPIGVIVEGNHAFNLVVVMDDEGKLCLYEIEPQLDVVHPFDLKFCAIAEFHPTGRTGLGEVRLIIF